MYEILTFQCLFLPQIWMQNFKFRDLWEMQVLYIPSKNHFQNESEHFLSKLSEHSEVIYIYTHLEFMI